MRSDISIYIRRLWQPLSVHEYDLTPPPTHGIEQTTTSGTSCPTLCDECVGSLTSPADYNTEDAGDGAYGL